MRLTTMTFIIIFSTVFVASCNTIKVNRSPSQSDSQNQEKNPPQDKYAKVTSPPAPFNAPAAIRLFEAQEFVRKNPAPDFWALIPYYIPQQKGTCAAASVAMVLNALNVHKKATSEDKLITPKDLIAAVNDKEWEKSMENEKCYDLDHLAGVVQEALIIYGHKTAEVKVLHVEDQSPQTQETLRKNLIDNEKSDRNFIIANFLQGQFTGDPGGMEGHMSPIGAYDSINRRVLIMDVDRDYYEPYWVSEKNFLAGMNTKDEITPKYRGYMMIKEK